MAVEASAAAASPLSPARAVLLARHWLLRTAAATTATEAAETTAVEASAAAASPLYPARAVLLGRLWLVRMAAATTPLAPAASNGALPFGSCCEQRRPPLWLLHKRRGLPFGSCSRGGAIPFGSCSIILGFVSVPLVLQLICSYSFLQ